MARAFAPPVRISTPQIGVDGRGIAGVLPRDPTITDGRIGDMWINSESKILFGPKVAGPTLVDIWPNKGLIRGANGWYLLTRTVSDGTRRVRQVYDAVGGEGPPPEEIGLYEGATGYVADIAQAVDVRGPEGPQALINGLADAGDITDDSMIATAEAGEENKKRPAIQVFDVGGELPRLTVAHAETSNVGKSIQIIRTRFYSTLTQRGGASYRRVNTKPTHPARFRTLDRWTAAGGIDSVNGGWWELADDVVNVFALGARGNWDGATGDNDSAFINNAAAAASALGRPLYLPNPGANRKYKINDSINIPGGLHVYGDGRTNSVLYVNTDFNMGANGVVQLGSNSTGATLIDIGIEFYQDLDETVRANVIQYPPAINAVELPRFQIDRVRISGAWVGLNAQGNTGGAWIGRLEVGALEFGMLWDGALDFVHIDSYHFWPFGMAGSPLETSVYRDGNTKAATFGAMDGLSVNALATFQGRVTVNGDPAGSVLPHKITSLQLDGDWARLVVTGSTLQCGEVYSTNSAGAQPSFVASGGRLLISNLHFVEAGTNHTIWVNGGFMQVSGGWLEKKGASYRMAQVDSGRLEILNTHWNIPAVARTEPYVIQNGGILVVKGNTASTIGASGPAIRINIDDAEHDISGNRLSNWNMILPTGAYLGCYGPNRVPIRTFSPTIAFETNGDFNPTYTAQSGRYEYETNGIRFQLRIVFSTNAFTTASGIALIGGLPVSNISGLNAGGVNVSLWGNIALGTGYSSVAAVLITDANQIALYRTGSGLPKGSISVTQILPSTTDIEIGIDGFIPTS